MSHPVKNIGYVNLPPFLKAAPPLPLCAEIDKIIETQVGLRYATILEAINLEIRRSLRLAPRLHRPGIITEKIPSLGAKDSPASAKPNTD